MRARTVRIRDGGKFSFLRIRDGEKFSFLRKRDGPKNYINYFEIFDL